MIRRFHEAKLADAPRSSIWGTGSPKREFLYVDDMASACVHVMDLPREVYAANTQVMASHINVGTGEDLQHCRAGRAWSAKSSATGAQSSTTPASPMELRAS